MLKRTVAQLSVVCGLVGSSLGYGQQAVVMPSPNLAGIAHVAVRVSNLDASVAFYERLGFVKAFALSRDGAVYEAFIKINDRQFIELYPATEKDKQIGFLHLCFEGKDLQAAHDFYVAEGLTPKDVRTAGAGNLLFTMPGPATPTGPQNLEYTQYMPGSLHSKDVGQHLGAERVAETMVSVTVASDDLVTARTFYADKLRFTGETIPGGSGERVAVVPVEPLGYKARITLRADGKKAGKMLKAKGVAFTKEKDGLVVVDPDGNEVVLGR